MIKRLVVFACAGPLCVLLICAAVQLVQPSAAAAAEDAPNACGCYRDSAGSCFCAKKARCGCAGDCEPKGCDEKREKQLQKDIAAATKQAAGGKQGVVPADKDRTREPPAPGDASSPISKKKPKPLSEAQKKDLVRLLDIYLAEHPEGASQTISEIRSAVGGR